MKYILLTAAIMFVFYTHSFAMTDIDEMLTTHPVGGDPLNMVDDYMRANAGYQQERFIDQDQSDTSWIYGYAVGETADSIGCKWLPLVEWAVTPSYTPNKVYLFALQVGSYLEFYAMNDTGESVQITSAGKMNSAAFDTPALAVDGSISMTGDLNMGTNAITNATNITADSFIGDVNGSADELAGYAVTNIGWKLVETKTFTDSSTVTFSGLDGDEDIAYKFIMQAVMSKPAGADPYIQVRMNGDAGNNYYEAIVYAGSQWGVTRITNVLDGIIFFYGASTVHWEIMGEATLYVKTENSLARKMVHQSYGLQQEAAHEIICLDGGGAWTNTADNVTDLTILNSDGTCTGTIRLYKMH